MRVNLVVITFVCRTCEDLNKQNLGVSGFEVLQTEFDSLTEAWIHCAETMRAPFTHAHYIDALPREVDGA